MRIRDCHILVEVCNELNMSKAAKNLYISQPAVSKCIGNLEEKYNITIFERLSKRLFLTSEGRTLLAYAKQFLALEKNISEHLATGDHIRKYAIGATVSVGTYMLPALMRDLREKYQAIEMNYQIDNIEVIQDMLYNSQVDFALIEGLNTSDELVVDPIYTDNLIVIARADHTFAKKQLAGADLAGAPFLIREKGSGARTQFLSALEELEVSINIQGEINNTEAIINGVKAGLGLGIVSRLAINEKDPDIAIVQVKDLHLPRVFSLSHHKDKYLTDELKELFAFIKENIALTAASS